LESELSPRKPKEYYSIGFIPIFSVNRTQDDAHGNSFGIHELDEYPDSAYYVPDAINSFLHYSSALFLQICCDGHFDTYYWSKSVAFLTGEYMGKSFPQCRQVVVEIIALVFLQPKD